MKKIIFCASLLVFVAFVSTPDGATAVLSRCFCWLAANCCPVYKNIFTALAGLSREISFIIAAVCGVYVSWYGIFTTRQISNKK